MQTLKGSCDISFSEKVRIYSYDYLKCCIYISGFDTPRYVFTKKLFSKMISSSQLLEDLLDFHGAKNNKEWYCYRELSAAIRHLSLGGYSQKHILNRLNFYNIPKSEEFEKQGLATIDFLTRSLMRLSPVIISEARRLKIPIPEISYDPEYFPGVLTGDILEHDIDDEDEVKHQQSIVKIASEFLGIARAFDQFGFYKPYDSKELKSFVPEKINEVEIRRYEMLVHNLQSSFDTYVIHGGYHYGNRKLKQMRGYISVIFHLLQIIGRLLHFYERHLLEGGYKSVYRKVRKQLAKLVDPTALLDCTINYGLFYVCFFLNSGTQLAREILNENIERSSVTVNIPMKLGFHSRPSLLVAKIVQHYGGKVELCVGDDRFDASSVLDIQWAGGKIHKEQITQVVFEGDVRALKDIEILAGANYGEDTFGKGVPLPKELAYLK